MIRAQRPITFSEHQGAETQAWEIIIGEPDRVEEHGWKLHVIDVDVLAMHDGLDRALVDAGLEMGQRIPWGTRGPQLMWIDRRPTISVAQVIEMMDQKAPWPTNAVVEAFQNEAVPETEPTPAQVIQMEDHDSVLACMKDGPASWLDLVRHSGLPMKHLSAAVQRLKKAGLVVQEGKEYRRA